MLTKKYVLVLLILLGLLNASCNSEKKMNIKKFEWEESKSASPGYPIEVYRGGVKRPEGGFTSLYGGLTTGKHGWGSGGGGISDGLKTLPNGLHVQWVSFAEDCVYEIDTPIDYDKILTLFKRGYYTPGSNINNPEPFDREYNNIRVGFAPGGVVVVWVVGIGRQIEIGRYQGQKITIPQEEIDQLEAPDNRLFKKEVRELRMKDVRVVPQAIQDAHKDRQIPYGRWDSIRKRYNWKINLELPKHLKSKKVKIYSNSGEFEILFGEFDIEQSSFDLEEELKYNTIRNRTIPNCVTVSYIDSKGILIIFIIEFNEEEIFKAFEEISKEVPKGEIELEIRVNDIETNAAVKLIGNNKEVWLPNSTIEISK